MSKPDKFLLSPAFNVALLWSPVANKSLFTSVEVSSFNPSLMTLSTLLVTLCFQNVSCTSSQGLLIVTVN